MSIEQHARATLDDLANRRRLVTSAIQQLAAFYGLDAAEWLEDNPAPGAHGNGTPVKPARGAKARPTHALSATQQRILAVLRDKGPMSPGAVATATGENVGMVRYHVRKLLAADEISATGKTNDRVLSLR